MAATLRGRRLTAALPARARRRARRGRRGRRPRRSRARRGTGGTRADAERLAQAARPDGAQPRRARRGRSGRRRPACPRARARGRDRRGARRHVKRFLQLALGILSAIGGFVDIGDIVFNVAAGAQLRLRADLGRRPRRRRDHRLLRDVRPRRGGLGPAGLRPRARAPRLHGRASHAAGGDDRDGHDLHGRGRRPGASCWSCSRAGSTARWSLLGAVALVLAAWFLRFDWIERVFGYAGPVPAGLRRRGRRPRRRLGRGARAAWSRTAAPTTTSSTRTSRSACWGPR